MRLPVGYYANVVEFNGKGLALCTDGVGSKTLIAQGLGKFDTIGIDCVAMNVNDLICVGARPISFLDYVVVVAGRRADSSGAARGDRDRLRRNRTLAGVRVARSGRRRRHAGRVPRLRSSVPERSRRQSPGRVDGAGAPTTQPYPNPCCGAVRPTRTGLSYTKGINL